MISDRGKIDNTTTQVNALAAHSFISDAFMSDHTTDKSTSGKPVLFQPDELEIYSNKTTHESFIFHGKKIDHGAIDHFEYDHKAHLVDVVMKDGTVFDLGVRIEWLVRPYLSKATAISIAQTKDGKSVTGAVLPLVHKNN